MDQLIEEGLNGIADPAARMPIYARTQELFAEDVPALVLHYARACSSSRTSMGGLPDEISVGTPLFFRGNEYSKG
jgi:hypothetical protein